MLLSKQALGRGQKEAWWIWLWLQKRKVSFKTVTVNIIQWVWWSHSSSQASQDNWGFANKANSVDWGRFEWHISENGIQREKKGASESVSPIWDVWSNIRRDKCSQGSETCPWKGVTWFEEQHSKWYKKKGKLRSNSSSSSSYGSEDQRALPPSVSETTTSRSLTYTQATATDSAQVWLPSNPSLLDVLNSAIDNAVSPTSPLLHWPYNLSPTTSPC